MPDGMDKAAIYTRISSDPTGQRLGVQRQEQECRTLCERLGWTVAAVYEDDDRSAYSGKPRPAYEQLLAAVEASEVTAVVAWHPDRLHRSPVELERFIDLVERTKIKVATVQAGEYDLTTASGRMTARVVGAVARGESEHKSERAKAKHRQLAQSGKLGGGGTRPFGYADDRRTIVTEEADLIREAVRGFLAGRTIRSLCAEWNEQGISTVTGGPWRSQVMRTLLGSGRIAGWREHRGALVAEAEWPAIISLDEHHAVNAILSDPSRRLNANSRRYLLTGFLFCALCGEKLVARPTADKRKKYVCSGGVDFNGCGKLSCIAAPIDSFVAGAVLERIAGVDLSPQPPVEVDTSEVRELEQRLDELAAMFAEGSIGQREWLVARQAIDERLTALQGDVSERVGRRASTAQIAALQASPEVWETLDVEQQRAVIGLFVERVTLGSAVPGRNFFDPSRVSVSWQRHETVTPLASR